MKKVVFIIVALGLMLGTLPASGQIIYREGYRVSPQLIYQTWKFSGSNGEIKFNQSALPVSVFLPLADNWEVHFSAAYSRSNLDDAGSDISLSSLTNSTVQAYSSFFEDRFFASLGLLLPTGETELDSSAQILAELISTDYLNLPVKRMGEGLGVMAQAGGVEQFGNLVLGGSVSYAYTGSYTYQKDGADYDPGDELTASVSVSAMFDPATLSLDIVYRYLDSDRVGGVEVFRDGGQLFLRAGGRFELPAATVDLAVLHVVRSEDSHRHGDFFRSDSVNFNGDKTILSASFEREFTGGISGSLLSGYRLVRANKYDSGSALYFGESNLFSIGAGLGYSSGDGRYSIFSRVVFLTGTADDAAIDITGTEFMVGGVIGL